MNLTDDKKRLDILNRLKRAEGQIRGIQRMIVEGEECRDITSQMSAVRRALDSTYVCMTVCLMEQELSERLADSPSKKKQLSEVMGEVQALLGKMR